MKLGRRVRFAGRGRERSWWLLLLPAVLWAVAQVLGWPLWARAVLAGLAAAAPLVVPEVRAWFGQDDTRARLVEERVTVSGGHGRLPQVQAVGLDHLRVHTARVQVPYIERDQQAKLEEAKATYQEAIDSSHADIAPLAAFNLGLLLRKQGDLERAKAAYQRAMDSGDPWAAVLLGQLLEKQDDLEGAKVAYQRAIDGGDAEVAPEAARNLEELLRSTPPPAAL